MEALDLKLRDSERFCAELARREARNFYWGFISLPFEQRIAIYALYGFARQVDDDADDPNRQKLPERLEFHRERIRRCMRGEWSDPVMHVLSYAVVRYRIPESELMELIDGVELDFFRKRYRTWEELEGYCRLVASVVGRMCVRIFGYEDEAALTRADELGVALQLTNILRDVREDAGMDRIYIPAEDLDRFGLRESELFEGIASDRWRALVAFEARRARALFASGYGVLRHIPRRAAVCVHTMAGIYERILEKIERDPDFPLRGRTSLSPSEKLLVMVGSWLRPV
ncbi:MAG: squalene/phytoene synthase family protein [Candidatus Eremiobacteraeota bacterium]|nr:squalene/phytoene synthase family protein [Candidatus Eremiobacteraeota bacterium]